VIHMRFEEAKRIFEERLAITAKQYARITKQHYQNARRRLREWVLQGKLAMLICEEITPIYPEPIEVIYYCLPKNVNKVEKWLKKYSNISVKKKLLLPESLSKE